MNLDALGSTDDTSHSLKVTDGQVPSTAHPASQDSGERPGENSWESELINALGWSRGSERYRDDCEVLVLLAESGAIDNSLRAAALSIADKPARAIAVAHPALPSADAIVLCRNDIHRARLCVAAAIAGRLSSGASLLEQLGLSDPDPIGSEVIPGQGGLRPDATADEVHASVIRHRDWSVMAERHWRDRGYLVHSGMADMRPMCAAAAHPRVELRSLYEMVKASPFAARFAQAAATSHAATESLLGALAELPSDPRCGYRRRWSGFPHEIVKAAVAAHRACSAALLCDLLSLGDLRIDIAVASNPSLDRALLDQLSRQPEEKVRAAIASRPDLESTLVDTLAKDPSLEVRAGLACSLSLRDDDLITRYCTDRYAAVRAGVARRPTPLPADARRRLRADTSARVRAAFAARSDLSPDEQVHIASDASPRVRAALAAHGPIAEPALTCLVADTALDVMMALAANETVDYASLATILHQLNDSVIGEMRARGGALIAQRDRKIDLVTALIIASEFEPGGRAKTIALSHPQCPMQVLANIAQCRDWVQSALMAANPSTPEAIRAELVDRYRFSNNWTVFIGAAESARRAIRSGAGGDYGAQRA